MVTLISTNNGCVVINEVPFQCGQLEVTPSDYRSQLLTVWLRRNGPSNPIIQKVPWSGLSLNGLPAESWNAVDAFVQANFFFEVNGTGEGGNGDVVNNYYQNNWASTNW